MNNEIYARIKRYEQNGVEFEDWFYKPSDHHDIYEKIMEITGNDHEVSDDVSNWCKTACIGAIYEFREGEVEIQYIN